MQRFSHSLSVKLEKHKKVLLRERKRHTARCVANTPYVVLTGYPPWGGYPGGTWSGTPPRGGVLDPPGGTRSGTPRGVPRPPVPGQVPPQGGTRSGTPPGGTQTPRGDPVRYPPGGYPVRYPPRGGTRTPLPPLWTDKHL